MFPPQVRLAAAECLQVAAKLLVQLEAANFAKTTSIAGVKAQLKEALQGTLNSDVNAGVKSVATDALSRLG